MASTSLVSANFAAQSPLNKSIPAAGTTPAISFSATMARTLTEQRADFVSGRLGIDLDTRGQPARVLYFDTSGELLTSSSFSAQQILKKTAAFGIDLNDLTALGEQLDSAGIGYRPYELYKGTGSDHGIDFADLISGGLGTAYDWRKDPNAGLKGATAQAQLKAAQDLSDSLGLTAHPEVTHNRGIDPTRFTPLASKGEAPRNHVMLNGHVAAWYPDAASANSAANNYRGTTIDLSQGTTETATVTEPQFSNTTTASPSLATAENGVSSRLQTKLKSLLEEFGSDAQKGSSAIDRLIESLTLLRQR